jgi:hypothetical protein
MEAEIRIIICVAFTGLGALAAVSAQGAPNPNQQNWHLLGPVVTFGLGDQGCGSGWHQALWRDWRGDWWWGPCVPDR